MMKKILLRRRNMKTKRNEINKEIQIKIYRTDDSMKKSDTTSTLVVVAIRIVIK